jgi:hypothetical protein
VRVWDIPPSELCDRHLLGEHAEIHAIWSVIKHGKRGYASHPEVMRWRGNLGALVARHDANAAQMRARGFRHASDLPLEVVATAPIRLLNSLAEQRALLKARACGCG